MLFEKYSCKSKEAVFMEFKEFVEKLQNISKWVLEQRKSGMDRMRMELLLVEAVREILAKFSIDGEMADKIVAGLAAHDEAATNAAFDEAEKKLFPNGSIDPVVIANFIGKAG